MLFNVTAELTGLAHIEPVGRDWTDPSHAYNIKVCCVVLGFDFLFHPRWLVWIIYFCCVVSGFDFLFHPRWLVWIVYFCCVVSGLDFLFPSSLIGLDRILLLVFGSGELFWGDRSSVAMLFGFSFLFLGSSFLLQACSFFFFFWEPWRDPSRARPGSRDPGNAQPKSRTLPRFFWFFFFFLLPSLICSAIVLGFCDNKGLKIES